MGNVTSPLTVGRSVNIFGTLSLSTAPGGDLKAGGSFYNAGVFNPNGRTVIFNGAGSQQIYGAADTAFAGLTIENTGPDSSGVTMQRNATVSDVLTLTDGMLRVQDKTLTLGASASVSGGSTASMVVTDVDGLTTNDGFLCKVYAGAGSFTFPVGDAYGVTQYSPSTLAFSGGLDDPSTVCVRATNARHPNWPGTDYPTYITRYWTANSTDNAFTGTASFTYDQADVVVGSGQTEAALHHKILERCELDHRSCGGHRRQHPLDAGEQLLRSHPRLSASPLAVELASFTANATGSGRDAGVGDGLRDRQRGVQRVPDWLGRRPARAGRRLGRRPTRAGRRLGRRPDQSKSEARSRPLVRRMGQAERRADRGRGAGIEPGAQLHLHRCDRNSGRDLLVHAGGRGAGRDGHAA